jgi:hypothetical protein
MQVGRREFVIVMGVEVGGPRAQQIAQIARSELNRTNLQLKKK